MKYIHEENKSRVSLGQRRERSRGAGLVGEKEGEMQRGWDSGGGRRERSRGAGLVGDRGGRGSRGMGQAEVRKRYI